MENREQYKLPDYVFCINADFTCAGCDFLLYLASILQLQVSYWCTVLETRQLGIDGGLCIY